MSNIISFYGGAAPQTDDLVLSNGGTDVFLNVLALSGAALARTESEKRLIVYLSERDQTAGRGCAGFAVTEMPWDRESFPADRRFMLRVIAGAQRRTGWERLDYRPDAAFVSRSLNAFACLIRRMTADEIQASALSDWLAQAEPDDPVRCGFPRCERHHTFLTCFGCQICNS